MHPDEVGAQLARLLASPLFAQSPRLSSFLRFVVQAAQAGQADNIKEYAIGVEVFDRGTAFDPRIDNIVRIQAAKLRSKLVEYYAGEGAADPILITIPKGSYAPEIRPRAVEQPKAAATPGRSRIAVLPFVNMSSDPENEYFSDGLTEELINQLACIPDLQVVARTSAFRFKGRNEDLREVGAKLNVGTVLEGSVRRSADQLRVTAQLIDVESGYHLFSKTYQREYKGIFELQDELARAVVQEVLPQSGVAHVAVRTRAVNLDAYNAYLRGTYALSTRFADLRQCIDLFQEALAADPDFAPAWAGLAQGYFLMVWFYQAPSAKVIPLARQAAAKALEIDPESAIGETALAVIECVTDWQWATAEARFRRVLERQPTLAMAYVYYGFCCLLPQMRAAEACHWIERGLALDPFNPLLHVALTYSYARSGRYRDALRQHELAREVAPHYPPVYVSAGVALERGGDPQAAIPYYQRGCEISKNAPFPLSCLGHALAITDNQVEARAILERLLAQPEIAEADIARVYSGLRNAEEALMWLEKAADRRSGHLFLVIDDSRFDWLLPQPRFRAILQRMGLEANTAKARSALPR